MPGVMKLTRASVTLEQPALMLNITEATPPLTLIGCAETHWKTSAPVGVSGVCGGLGDGAADTAVVAESEAAVVVVSPVVGEDVVWVSPLWLAGPAWASDGDDCVDDEFESLFEPTGPVAAAVVADWSTGADPSAGAVAAEPDASVEPGATDGSAGPDAVDCVAEASADAVWSVDTAPDEVVLAAAGG